MSMTLSAVQVENHTETFDRRMERLEGNQQAMMSLIQTFMGSPQILTAVSMGFIYLMDATGCRHPVPRTMALSFEVRFVQDDSVRPADANHIAIQ